MKTRLLLSCLIILLFAQLINAQLQHPEPGLRACLQKYAADNHLYAGGTYIFFDTASKKSFRFSPKDFMVEVLPQPQKAPAMPSASQSNTGNQLRGAAGNFHLVRDVNTLTDANPGNNSSNQGNQPFVVLNNVSYFTADDGIHGKELWKTDGTAVGTYLVREIVPGSNSSNLFNMVASGNYIYFDLYNTVSYAYELWKSDGTAAGTGIVLNFPYPPYFGAPANLCNVNGTLYFTIGHTYPDDQLWKSNGTSEGTLLVKDFGTEGGYNLHSLVSSNGLLYFVGAVPAYGSEVWRSNGTDTGTYMLKDINPATYDFGFMPSQLTDCNGKLYFAESDNNSNIINNKLWETDGTSNGTKLVPSYNNVNVVVNSLNSSYVNAPFTVSNNVLYFSGNTYKTGTELYKYDISDTTAGIQLVKDLTPGAGGTIIYAGDVTDVNGAVYFLYTDSATHFYKTNGTDSSTISIKDFATIVIPPVLYNGNGKLYFDVFDSSYGYEPWVSDGTTKGTVLLEDVYPGAVSSYPNYFTSCNGKVLFTAYCNLYGNELFVSTGSDAQLVREINTTTTSGSNPFYMTAFNNGVLLNAYTFDKGYEL